MAALNVSPGCVLMSEGISGCGRPVVRGHDLPDLVCLEECTPLHFHLHPPDSSAHLSGSRETISPQQPAQE